MQDHKNKGVKQVIDSVKTHGVRDTYQMVMNKFTTHSPLGT